MPEALRYARTTEPMVATFMGAMYCVGIGSVDDRGMDHDEVARPAMRQMARRVVYHNRWMTVTEDDIELLDGTTSVYGVVHKSDYALVIPLDGGRVHLVEQYRYPVGGRFWEFPQGSLPDAQQAPPEVVAARELAEETGLRASDFTVLGFLHDAYGVASNGFHVVLATGLTQGPVNREPEEQDMRSAWFDLASLWDMIADGRMTDSASVAALALLGRHQGR
jgi:8-oxo-dGTP pyrophosphatase MutT (NUDIX family)